MFRAGALVCLSAAATGLVCASIAPEISEWYWAFELPGHFPLQLASIAVALGTALALLRAWWGALLCIALAGLQLAGVASLFDAGPHKPTTALGYLRMLVINVNTSNPNHATVQQLISRLRPDIVGLIEVDDRWLEDLSKLERWYPYQVDRPRDDNFGVALLSRFPLERSEVRPLYHPDLPLIVGHFTIHGRPITLAVAHPVPPARGRYVALRNHQLEELSSLRREFADREFILLGDLNTTPWSNAFAKLIDSTGLRNSAEGFGYRPTWPVQLPLAMIPIDFCLVSSGLAVKTHRIESPTGSDHLPVFVELAVLPPQDLQ